MIGRIVHYRSLRRNNLPHRLAWSMSGLRWFAHGAARWAGYAVIAAGCLYLMSSVANSAQSAADGRASAKAQQQAGEIDALRRIVAACLSDATGKPVKIGDEWFFCGITSIGTFE